MNYTMMRVTVETYFEHKKYIKLNRLLIVMMRHTITYTVDCIEIGLMRVCFCVAQNKKDWTEFPYSYHFMVLLLDELQSIFQLICVVIEYFLFDITQMTCFQWSLASSLSPNEAGWHERASISRMGMLWYSNTFLYTYIFRSAHFPQWHLFKCW